MNQNKNQNKNFLALTSPVSPPFVPSTLDTLRKTYQSQPSSEEVVVGDSADPISAALMQERNRALSDVSDLGLSGEPTLQELHTRADSTTSNPSTTRTI